MRFGENLIGYDFCIGSLYLPPLIQEDGGFFGRYAHILPALFLNQFIKQNTRVDMQYSVICHGYDYAGDEETFDKSYAIEMAKNLIKSKAFRDVLRKWYRVEMVTKDGGVAKRADFLLDWRKYAVRRVCIWLMTKDHVFAVVWEKHKNLDIVYPIDNYNDNPYRVWFIESFVEKIRSIEEKALSLRIHTERNRFVDLEYTESIVSADEVPVEGTLACVSFMARCSAFLCTFEGYTDFLTDVPRQLANVFIRDFSVAYRSFEDKLFELLQREQDSGRCLWLPKDLNCKFINIDNVHLMSVDYNDRGEEIVSNARHLSYNGVGHASLNQTWVGLKCDDRGKCSLQSLYLPPPVPHYSLQKASALLADCGSLVAGLRLCARK
jgi:hypothetical protein